MTKNNNLDLERRIAAARGIPLTSHAGVENALTLSERFARLSALVLMWERSKQSVDRLKALSLANVIK